MMSQDQKFEKVPDYRSPFSYSGRKPGKDLISKSLEDDKGSLAVKLAAILVLIEEDYPGTILYIMDTLITTMNHGGYRRSNHEDPSYVKYEKEFLEILSSDEILNSLE